MGIIRTLLALIVLISHTEPLYGFNFLGGKIAVQAFYVISGFYMALILNEKYIGANNSYKLFITNRLIRLHPIYWAILLLAIGFSFLYALISSGESFGYLNIFINHFDNMTPLSIFLVIFSNIFIIFQDALLFLELNIESGSFFFQSKFNKSSMNGFDFALIPQAWTVSLEIMFYLIAPFIVRRKTYLVIILFFIFLGLKLFLQYGLEWNHTPWNFRFFPSELTYFILGILSYKIYASKKALISHPKRNSLIFFGILIFILLYDSLTFNFKNHLFFIVFALSIPFIFYRSKHNKIDRYIGELSYPIYLIHILIISIVNRIGFQIPLSLNISVMLLSILSSIAIKHLISDKIEKLRQSRIKP
jgi:peptidoglycan/LPS O-acetylase OafA/YrhL